MAGSKLAGRGGPSRHPFRPLNSDRILFDGQPIALVVADSYEAARDAGSLISATYEVSEHCTELERKRLEAYVPPKKRSGIPPPPDREAMRRRLSQRRQSRSAGTTG